MRNQLGILNAWTREVASYRHLEGLERKLEHHYVRIDART